MAVVDAVDPRAAGRTDDNAATHADADAGTIRVKMTGSHQDSTVEDAEALQGGFQFAANSAEASLRRIGADDIHGTDVAPAMETDQKKPRFACTAHFDFHLAPFHAVLYIQPALAELADAHGRAEVRFVILERIPRSVLLPKFGKDLSLILIQGRERANPGELPDIDVGVLCHLHQQEIKVLLEIDHGRIAAIFVEHLPPLLGRPSDGETVDCLYDLQRPGGIDVSRQIAFAHPRFQAKQLTRIQSHDRKHRKENAQADAQYSETSAGYAIALTPDAHQRDQAKDNGKDRTHDRKGAQESEDCAGQGPCTRDAWLRVGIRRLDRLLALRTENFLSCQ